MDSESQPEPHGGVGGRLACGARIGRYQILRHLATGGMADVYLAAQAVVGDAEKIVVLKRIRPHLADDDAFRAMFLNEAKVATGLSHSNLVGVLDFGESDGWNYLVLDFVHGDTLRALLKEVRPLPVGVALTIVKEVGMALEYLHGRRGPQGLPLGLVHRDVSPSNIMVTFAGEVKLLDLGIAKAVEEPEASRSTLIKGKVHYMAPEQVRGEAIDARTDLFALGVVLYELTTGRRCFAARGELALLNRVAEARVTPPSTLVEGFPPSLEALLLEALAKDPSDRFQDARQMVVAVERVAEGLGCSLSRVRLGDFIADTLSVAAYPTSTDFTPALEPVPTVVERQPTRRGAGPRWAVAIAAVAAGAAAIALGASRAPEPTVAEPLFSSVSSPDVPPQAPDPMPAVAPELDPEPATPQPTHEVSAAPETRVAPRRKRRRPRKRKVEATPSPSSKVYLPPSHQPGRG